MNCASCNTPLIPGNNICPNCGALNMSFNAPMTSNQGDVQSNEEVINNTPVHQVSNGPVIEEGPAVVMPQPVQTQPVQPQVVQTQVVQPQVVQTTVVQPQVIEQPAIAPTPAVEVLDDSAFSPTDNQVDLDIPAVSTAMPTLGDGDGVVEGNESAMIVDDTHVPEIAPMPQMIATPMPQNDSMEMFNELNDDEELQVTETMAPPTLNIQDDVSLTAGVGSLQSDNVSTYSNEELQNQQVEEHKNKRREQDNVNFAIPSVSGEVSEVSSEVMDGGIPDMDVTVPTAGVGDGIVEGNESQVVVTEETNNEVKNDETAKGKKKGLNLNLGSLNLKDIKSSKMLPLPFVIIGVVVFLIIGIVIGSTLLGTQTYTAGSYNRSKINANELPRVADGKNNTTKAGAFTFKIPKDYYYDRINGGIAIYDNKDTFRIYIRSEVGIYDDLATAKTSVIKTLEAQKVIVNSYKETTINKKNYVVIQGATNVNNRLIAFTDAGHDYIFYIEIVTKDNAYNNDLVSIADDIIRNTKYNEKQSEMEMINVYDISEVVIKASMEYKKINTQNTN